MLSRTADHLYWMSRYTERAENTARMLDVNYQTSLLPQSAEVAKYGWQGVLSISELLPWYNKKYDQITPNEVMEFMVKDESNASSIVSCLKAARENARAVRGALTTEAWETQNTTWLEVNRMLRAGDFERDPGQFFEWVKFRSHLSRGVTLGTMLQDEAFYFSRLGTFLERADNTARLVDVKFHALQQRVLRRRHRGRPGVRLLSLERHPAQRLGLRGLPQGLPRRDQARARGRAADSSRRHAALAARQPGRGGEQPGQGAERAERRNAAPRRQAAGRPAVRAGRRNSWRRGCMHTSRSSWTA
jgi:hypothetical protein